VRRFRDLPDLYEEPHGHPRRLARPVLQGRGVIGGKLQGHVSAG
jgi:hypothetical protein